LDVTAPRCPCVRDGVPMKLAEGRRPGRVELRAEPRALIDRIQAGEEIPRLTPLISGESDGGAASTSARPRNRPPRPERPREHPPQPVREVRTPEPRDAIVTMPSPPPPPAQTPPVADDDFGAGLGSGDSPAAQ
jgi:hypothetical protein